MPWRRRRLRTNPRRAPPRRRSRAVADRDAEADDRLFDRAPVADRSRPRRSTRGPDNPVSRDPAGAAGACRSAAGIPEPERRVGPPEHDVGVVVRLDRADIGPVAANRYGCTLCAPIARGISSRPKSMARPPAPASRAGPAREHVDAHRGENGCFGVVRREHPRLGTLRPDRLEPSAFGFSSNATMLAVARRSGRCPSAWQSAVDRLRGDGDVGIRLEVRVDQLRSSPSGTDVVAGENQVVVGFVLREVPRAPGARHRPCPGTSAGSPASARRPGSRRTRPRTGPAGRSADVPVERRRVELRQHEDAPDLGVQAAADRDVDQPVPAADRHGGLRPVAVSGKRRAPCPPPRMMASVSVMVELRVSKRRTP